MTGREIFIDFGALTVYWYGVFVGIAALTALLLFALLRRAQGERFSDALQVSLIAMPAALIGARVFYCWFAQSSFPEGPRDWLRLTSGGYALYGALAGVLVVLMMHAALTKKCAHSAVQAIDAAVPAVSAAITIGRFAGRTGGGDTGFALSDGHADSLPFVIWSEAEQSYVLWVGFFEGITALCILILTLIIFLLTYRWKKQGFASGGAALLFMVTYGLTQTMWESMRGDSLYMVTLGFVRISQIISFAMAVAALVTLIVKGCLLQKPRVSDITLWVVCAAALGTAVYCEFTMNSAALVGNYIMMGLSLGIMMVAALYLFFRNAKLRDVSD